MRFSVAAAGFIDLLFTGSAGANMIDFHGTKEKRTFIYLIAERRRPRIELRATEESKKSDF